MIWTGCSINNQNEYEQVGWDIPKTVHFILVTSDSRAMRGEYADFLTQIWIIENKAPSALIR